MLCNIWTILEGTSCVYSNQCHLEYPTTQHKVKKRLALQRPDQPYFGRQTLKWPELTDTIPPQAVHALNMPTLIRSPLSIWSEWHLSTSLENQLSDRTMHAWVHAGVRKHGILNTEVERVRNTYALGREQHYAEIQRRFRVEVTLPRYGQRLLRRGRLGTAGPVPVADGNWMHEEPTAHYDIYMCVCICAPYWRCMYGEWFSTFETRAFVALCATAWTGTSARTAPARWYNRDPRWCAR